MKNTLNFFIKIGELNKIKRKGVSFYGVENPDTVTDHSFRLAVMVWVFADKKKLNVERAVKMALIHDIHKIRGKNDKILSQVEMEKNGLAGRWRRSSLKEKEKIYFKRVKKEKRAVKKLVSNLPSELRDEITGLYIDYMKASSFEGKFVSQTDIIENLIEAFEQRQNNRELPVTPWWKHIGEAVDNPVLLRFLEEIEREDFNKKGKGDLEMKNILTFFTELGKLKSLPRRGLVLIGAKNPNSILSHSFRSAIMSWILGEKKNVNFNIERLIKIALIHDICELYAGDMTPYDYGLLPEDKGKWPEIFDTWPRYSKAEKIRISFKKHNKEKEALEKLTAYLPSKVRKEILDLWLDYESGKTKEGRFVSQTNRIETLLEALEASQEKESNPFKSWWVGTEERVDDPLLLGFMPLLEEKFYSK